MESIKYCFKDYVSESVTDPALMKYLGMSKDFVLGLAVRPIAI